MIIDILRATTCWITALAHDARSIRPVTTIKECLHWGHKGYLTAGERGGQKIERFDLGNSPFDYTEEKIRGKRIAVTTTNGSRTVQKALKAGEIYCGAFVNIQAAAEKLRKKSSVVLLCSGWEGKPGMEDVLFAGELISRLSDTHEFTDDAALMAFELFKKAKPNPAFFLSSAQHVKRLTRLGLKKDVNYCLQKNSFDIVPGFEKGEFILR